MKIIEVSGWTRSEQIVLSKHQPIYMAGYSSLAEIVSNGRRNIMVVASHQDDEVIGMGGTIRLYATGIDYEIRENSDNLLDTNPQAFHNGGLGLYPNDIIIDIMNRLTKSGKRLILPPQDPSNILVVYVTNGAKTERTVKDDLNSAHPENESARHARGGHRA